MLSKINPRLAGVLMFFGGLALLHWNHSMVVNEGRYFIKIALAGPILTVGSLYHIIAGAPLKPFKPSPLGWFCYTVGIMWGLANADVLSLFKN